MEAIVDGLKHDPFPSSAVRLRGSRAAYRIREGNYRILYEVHATEVVVYVFGIAHRKEVHRILLQRKQHATGS